MDEFFDAIREDCLPGFIATVTTFTTPLFTPTEYVRGNVPTNSIENFWSLLKRTINGTYVSIQAEHRQKYVEEQPFRHNNRETNDQRRFMELIKSIGGKGITYKELVRYQSSH